MVPREICGGASRSAVIALLLSVCACARSSTDAARVSRESDRPRTLLIRAENLVETKRLIAAGDTSVLAAYRALMREADTALVMRPVSVTEKQRMPPSGDKRDYMSMAPYWWPDSTKPNGLPFVRRDGRVYPPARTDHDGARFGNMSAAVEALALAHLFTGDERYASKAGELLRVFFLDDRTGMKPNLNYGQAVLGITDGRGFGMIELRRIPHLLDALRLLEGSSALTAEQWRALTQWWRDYYRWSLESTNGKEERATTNNHGTFYDVQVGAMALYLGDSAMARERLVHSAKARLDAQLDAEGWQREELARTRPFHYSVMNLEGFTELAELGRTIGSDLWEYRSKHGATIGDALRRLAPFADTTRTFPKPSIQRIQAQDQLVLLRRGIAVLGDQELSRSLTTHLSAALRRGHRTRLFYPNAP
jgi:hypothetical protein